MRIALEAMFFLIVPQTALRTGGIILSLLLLLQIINFHSTHLEAISSYIYIEHISVVQFLHSTMIFSAHVAYACILA